CGLAVTTGGITTSPVRFRRASFVLGLQHFYARYEQTDVARPMPKLVVARLYHATVIVGDYLYVIGGAKADGTADSSIERALINADGTLGPFTLIPVSLRYPRYLFTAHVIGQFLYVIGGKNQWGVLGVEYASINREGTLGSFSTVDWLLGQRYMHASVVIGNYLYLLGGPYDNIEAVKIHPNGALDRFSKVADVSINQPRLRPSAAVLGN